MLLIESDFDIGFVAGLALREKQIQQNYRPVIAVHKWFARRPGTLFRALLLAEFGSGPLEERFFQANNLKGLRVADPFMGGGTPLLEANRLGCDTVGFDINPMAHWIVRQEIEWLDVEEYREAAARLLRRLENRLGHLYRTRCLDCGSQRAPVKYCLWVKTMGCDTCGGAIDLFPGYLVSENRRHPRHIFVCAACGELTETLDGTDPGHCRSCGNRLLLDGPAKRNRVACRQCGRDHRFPDSRRGAPQHRLFALEYHCYDCKRAGHAGRFFKAPDKDDQAKLAEARSSWLRMRPIYVPNDAIPDGDETDRLHRWGYRYYREMFNERQLFGLETSARLVAQEKNREVRDALATNFSDLLRYQNMLCRYDTGVLKSVDIFSVHGFPVNLVQCESNLLGIPAELPEEDIFGETHRTGSMLIGSGGWANIIDKYTRAKTYCAAPYEVRFKNGRKTQVPIPEEWIGARRPDLPASAHRDVELHCESATCAKFPDRSFDAVLTDPPYFANVQYAELMDFCFVWSRRLLGDTELPFRAASTRSPDELTGNDTMDRGLDHFAEGLSQVFCRMAKSLKPGGPFAFTYHNNSLDAYLPIAVAVLDAGLTCTATLPCPAEMAASVHINGTSSSVIDTIFVCRFCEPAPSADEATVGRLAAALESDVAALRRGGLEVTAGDVRCILFGHVIRLAIQELRQGWNPKRKVQERLRKVKAWWGASRLSPFVREKLNDNLERRRRAGNKVQRRARVRDDNTTLPF